MAGRNREEEVTPLSEAPERYPVWVGVPDAHAEGVGDDGSTRPQGAQFITVRGAQTHNLGDVSRAIPKHQLVVFTGVSGSGKSSLVFDTLYTEAQRQLINTFSTFARQRLPQLTRPPVEEIRNLSPCIVIDQKPLGRSSRSTVGTATEIYTYLRMLFSRCGRPFIGWSHRFSFNHPEGMCPSCKGLGRRFTVDVEELLDRSKSIEGGAIQHPDYAVGKWYWREIAHTGVVPADVPLSAFSEGEMTRLLWADGVPLDYEYRGQTQRRRFEGVVRKMERLHLNKDAAQWSGTRRKAFDRFFTTRACPDCGGARLHREAREVKLADGRTLPELVKLELTDLDVVLEALLARKELPLRPVVETLVTKVRQRLRRLIDIGAGYLSLDRSVPTLSGGESQRVKMARQLDCGLVDMMYVLDEPSTGLHPRDVHSLVAMLHQLRDNGNSVLVVEHELDIVRAADWVVEMGPAAGEGGGHVLFAGAVAALTTSDTPTGAALRNDSRSDGDASASAACSDQKRRSPRGGFLLEGVSVNNLQDISVEIPFQVLTCLTGVAGSGKSTLVKEFVRAVTGAGQQEPAPEPPAPEQLGADRSSGAQTTHRVVMVEQKPLGRSARSNPASYVGAFDGIRKVFALVTGTAAKDFSFNSQGACANCKGRGELEMELGFLDDVRMPCAHCQGRRYRNEVLERQVLGRSIHDVLEMTVREAVVFFGEEMDAVGGAATTRNRLAKLRGKIGGALMQLEEVGLSYLRLGQSLSTLSGGEGQRLKLATELTRQGGIYVMDEPTTGLHAEDVARLLRLLHRLVDAGNTVVVVEHNLDVIGAADWVIDLGPGGGRLGGRVVAEGTPESLLMAEESVTGQCLNAWFGR